MSFVTSKRAHSIEKGNCDWDNIDKIEKPRCRHTQRNMAGSTKANSDSSDRFLTVNCSTKECVDMKKCQNILKRAYYTNIIVVAVCHYWETI